jgi:hypothetical protein
MTNNKKINKKQLSQKIKDKVKELNELLTLGRKINVNSIIDIDYKLRTENNPIPVIRNISISLFETINF